MSKTERGVPMACPLCASPSELNPVWIRGMLYWNCSNCKDDFRLIVNKRKNKEKGDKNDG